MNVPKKTPKMRYMDTTLTFLIFKNICHILNISIEPTHVEIKFSIHDHISIEIEMRNSNGC
jgi:hypothetical protein